MTAKIGASADGTKVTIGNAAEMALEIDATAKTIKALAPYSLQQSGPAFSAWTSVNIQVANGAFNPIIFNTEDFDTANCFDAVSGRFTPNVQGYYQINFAVAVKAQPSASIIIALFKNTTRYFDGYNLVNNGVAVINGVAGAGAVVYLNGTTDFVQVQGYSSNANNEVQGALRSNSNFSASLVRAA